MSAAALIDRRYAEGPPPGCDHALVMWEVERRGQWLRVWDDARGPLGDGGEGVAVEWAADYGPRWSYGLLGGREAQPDGTDLVVPVRFESRLAGASDWVEFGLPDEYRGAVLDVFGSEFEVVVAVHHRIESSEYAFRRLARMVIAVLAQPVISDAELWTLWDSTR